MTLTPGRVLIRLQHSFYGTEGVFLYNSRAGEACLLGKGILNKIGSHF